jgi:hypothetical protein
MFVEETGKTWDSFFEEYRRQQRIPPPILSPMS